MSRGIRPTDNVEGFIDSASMYEIVLALARQNPTTSFALEWNRALAVTAALMNADHLKLPPSPQTERSASGVYGVLLNNLGEAVKFAEVPDQIVSAAVTRTKRWAKENSGTLRNALHTIIGSKDMKADRQAALWLQSHVENEWIEHTKRRGSLFESEFAGQIAVAVGVSLAEVRAIHQKCADVAFVRELTQFPDRSDAFKLVTACFASSALLRGRYYDSVAKRTGRQILAHPVRQLVVGHASRNTSFPVHISNYERYLTNIVLAAAYAERRHDRRVALWADNLLTIRKARHRISFAERNNEETALLDAVSDSRKFGLRVHGRWIEDALDASLTIGSTVFTSLWLDPYPSIAASLGWYAATKASKVSERIATISARSLRLRTLARAGPGRVIER